MVLLTTKSAVESSLKLGNVSMNLHNFQVTVGDDLVDLSYQEFELLRMLCLQPNKILPHDEMTLLLWNAAGYRFLRRLAVLIHRLRTKLADSEPYVLKGVRGRGYGLVALRPPKERGAQSA